MDNGCPLGFCRAQVRSVGGWGGGSCFLRGVTVLARGHKYCTAGLSSQALSTCVPSTLLSGCMRTVAAVAAAELVI